MAKESIVERVLKESEIMVNKVIGQLAEEFKDTRPVLGQVNPNDAIWAVDNLGYEDMDELKAEFGENEINKMLYQVYKWKTDKRRKING